LTSKKVRELLLVAVNSADENLSDYILSDDEIIQELVADESEDLDVAGQ